jgi:hypothetical protein
LSIARLLSLQVPVPWHEAVAVVCAADTLSADSGIPITLEHCHVTLAGEVQLSRAGGGPVPDAMSSLQLLGILLAGQVSDKEFHVLAAASTSRAAAREGDGRLAVDLRWCMSAEPRHDIARLAARHLGADPSTAGERMYQSAQDQPPSPPLIPKASEVTSHRSVRITIRLQRLSPAARLAMAAVLLAAAFGAASLSALLGVQPALRSPGRVPPVELVMDASERTLR